VLAVAGVSWFRLNEVVTASPAGDPAARYIEVEVFGDGCLFPTSVLRAYDAAGNGLGEVAPFASTTCFSAGTYLLFATPAAQSVYLTAADGAAVPTLPTGAGQLCLVSSTTRYDCVRWGPISVPVHDLGGGGDDTSAVAAPGGFALARISDFNVIEADWRVETPTPRGPNDGTPWEPKDGGVDAPTDAPPDDAGIDARPIDAPFVVDAPRLDANDRFLDLDPGGGASCGCGSGGGPVSAGLAALVIVAVLAGQRRWSWTRRRSRVCFEPRASQRPSTQT
jgi:hypothetical protein